jgi:hypothetical protein
LSTGDNNRSGLDDPRLSLRNLRNGFAQAINVVEVDGSEDGYISIGDIRRIPRTAHSHFENRDVDGCIGECGDR